MTLGGLALAVGVLVDDATVTIENIERFLEEGHDLREAILGGAGQIAVVLALVSPTLCICIVFPPMFFLGGVARYLFVPLAGSGGLRACWPLTFFREPWFPLSAMYLLKSKHYTARFRCNPLVLFSSAALSTPSNGSARATGRCSSSCYPSAKYSCPSFCWPAACLFVLIPFLGQDFFPNTDSGQFILHVRAKRGTRIEETARLCDLVETSIRGAIPAAEIGSVID